MKKLIFSFLLFFLFIPFANAKELNFHLFYSETCPHCHEELEYIEDLKKEYTNVTFNTYEVTRFENKENNDLLKEVKKTLDDYNNYVPYTVIGSYSIVGFNDNTKTNIVKYLDYCNEFDCTDVVSKVKNGEEVIIDENGKEKDTKFTLPFFKEIDAKKVSLPLLAVVIGFIDGFNPCAMWVLIFLISMMLTMKNRKRMWALGLTFLSTSALIYLLFMVAWLKVTIELSSISYIRILIGIVALIGSFVNIRSYIKTRKDAVGCTVTNSEQRKKTAFKVKKIIEEKSFLLAIIGIILLAISVNFVELACSAGLPVIFTQILALNDLSTLQYAIYILIYILFYLIDDIAIFVIAMVTLKVTGITNKYSKFSHLIGGVIMLIIGLLMIFKPGILMFNI